MKIAAKLSANALVFTVTISLVLGIVCSSFILLSFYNRQHQLRHETDRKLNINFQSALNLVLADTVVHAVPQIDTLDLFDEQSDSVIIQKETWGLFELATVTAFSNQKSRQKSFIYGGSLPDYMNACVYMADHQRSLSLSGNAQLNGNAYLSRAGIKAAYVNQRPYAYNTLLNGKLQESEQQLPLLDPAFTNYLYRFADTSAFNVDKLHIDALDSGLVAGFSDTAKEIVHHGDLLLENIKLQGHVIVRSDSLIEVDASAMLENVILIAPVVKFRNGCKATVQVIAKDSIVMGNDCMLEYPASLVLLKRKKEQVQNKLMIGKDCIIDGIVLSVCDTADVYKSYIEIGERSLLKGIAYTMGYLSLKGNVDGVVMTDYFIHRTPSTIYENYLVDVVVDRNKLSSRFIGSAIFRDAGKKNVIGWLQ